MIQFIYNIVIGIIRVCILRDVINYDKDKSDVLRCVKNMTASEKKFCISLTELF